MKTITKIILIPLMATFIFFACSKDDDSPTPKPTPVTTLSSINPESGLKESEVTIIGKNFGTDKSKVKVFFNTTEATVQSVTNTQIKTIVPVNGSTGAVKITVNGTTITGPVFTYLQPTLSSISPDSAPVDTKVTFIGSNFGTDASKVQVFFPIVSMGEPYIEAVIESVSNTEVVVLVPIEATTGNVRMVVDGTELNGPEFTLLEPTLTNFAPESGPTGTEITITGSTFGTDATKVHVYFNGTEAIIQSLTDTEIKVLVPESATTGIVEIVVGASEYELIAEFTVLPRISSISPTSGIRGTKVTISGSSFVTATGISPFKVYFNDKQAAVTSITDSQITAIVPLKAFSGEVKIIVDGNEYVGPVFNYIVSEIEVSTFAGGDIGFTNGNGELARFNSPVGVAIDQQRNILVADADNFSIRKINPEQEVSTFIGNGTSGDLNGTGTEARLSEVSDVVYAFSSGEYYITDNNNFKIKKVTLDGAVTTYAGSGLYGSDNGPALSARFMQTSGVAIDSQGNVFVVENNAHKIRKITPDGDVSTFAGANSFGSADGNGTNAQFNFPYGIAIDSEDNLYITDSANHKIRKITPNGDVTTLAGSTYGFADGQGTSAQFSYPIGITIDKQGVIYVCDASNHAIRMITPDGLVSTIAGNGSGFANGEGMSAQFNSPRGITIDALGDLYVADRGNHRIRKITQE